MPFLTVSILAMDLFQQPGRFFQHPRFIVASRPSPVGCLTDALQSSYLGPWGFFVPQISLHWKKDRCKALPTRAFLSSLRSSEFCPAHRSTYAGRSCTVSGTRSCLDSFAVCARFALQVEPTRCVVSHCAVRTGWWLSGPPAIQSRPCCEASRTG